VLPIQNKILFPSSFWGIFDIYIFFVFFNNFGKRKNVTLQRRDECHKHTSSRRKDKTDVQSNDTQEKSLLGPKVSRCRGKVLQGLRIRHASDGSVERSMEPTLNQRHRYENAVNKTNNGNILRCKFNEPREGKLDGFSYLESLKKRKRRI
jgi:hypothetical protein